MYQLKAVVIETLVVVTIGLALGGAANALSPRGLKLTHDYFAGANRMPSGRPATQMGKAANAAGSLSSASQRLQQRGLQLLTRDEVLTRFRDPRYDQDMIVFIDARAAPEYAGGHIPGAWQFDHYHAETYLPTILPVCFNAVEVIVYCAGGECEDSEFAAITLRDAGVPPSTLYVYPGGINDWKAHGLPIEVGPRRSGDLLKMDR